MPMRVFGKDEKYSGGSRSNPSPHPLPQGEREVLIRHLP
jgi:hypothetical protein